MVLSKCYFRQALKLLLLKQDTQKMKNSLNCKNCNSKFEGNFCNQCGEKVLKDGDFAIMKILSQAFDTFTHIDSKLVKTLKLLIFYPGKLSKLNTEGIRVPYMKPFQIFVIINVLFFIIFSNDDLFRVPSHYFFKENYDGFKTLEKVRNISEAKGLSETEIASLYDSTSTNLAKGLLIFLIPLIALVGKLFNYKQKMEFGKHLIFSVHFFTFILSLFIISSLFLSLSSSAHFIKTILVLIGLCVLIYSTVAQKTFYNNTSIFAIIKGICSTFLIAVMLSAYKMLISVLAIYSL